MFDYRAKCLPPLMWRLAPALLVLTQACDYRHNSQYHCEVSADCAPGFDCRVGECVDPTLDKTRPRIAWLDSPYVVPNDIFRQDGTVHRASDPLQDINLGGSEVVIKRWVHTWGRDDDDHPIVLQVEVQDEGVQGSDPGDILLQYRLQAGDDIDTGWLQSPNERSAGGYRTLTLTRDLFDDHFERLADTTWILKLRAVDQAGLTSDPLIFSFRIELKIPPLLLTHCRVETLGPPVSHRGEPARMYQFWEQYWMVISDLVWPVGGPLPYHVEALQPDGIRIEVTKSLFITTEGEREHTVEVAETCQDNSVNADRDLTYVADENRRVCIQDYMHLACFVPVEDGCIEAAPTVILEEATWPRETPVNFAPDPNETIYGETPHTYLMALPWGLMPESWTYLQSGGPYYFEIGPFEVHRGLLAFATTAVSVPTQIDMTLGPIVGQASYRGVPIPLLADPSCRDFHVRFAYP